jgi:predicted aldo/keto reductase-like oxidoreductase
MQKRALGKTGLQVSVLGFGGFHLVEITSGEAARLLGAYLDQGGNYVETAAGYGNGISEAKIGTAVSHRRADYVLATKSVERTRLGFLNELDRSLRNLKTDHVDVMFVHGVQTMAEVDQILAPGGALEGAQEARQAGKLRFLAISGHGRPDALLAAVRRRREQGVGVIAMKSLADGYLYRSAEPALRYTLSLPVATVAAGINSAAMLETDLDIVSRFTPMSEAEKEELYRTAPELGSYICRLCGKCRTADFDPQKVFLLEGVFDRQMDDMRVTDTALYALRERLKHWFAQTELAKTEYEALAGKVEPSKDYSALSALCPYGIDIDRKLKIAHGKLSRELYLA